MSDRKQYNQEFKESAVRLVIEEGRLVKEVAENLGIHPQMLSKWKRKYEKKGAGCFPGQGKLKPKDEEIRQLQKQLKDTQMERDILS